MRKRRPECFRSPAKVVGPLDRQPPHDQLNALVEKRKAETQRAISERNARFFEAEADKLEGWADDLKLGLEREIKELRPPDQGNPPRRYHRPDPRGKARRPEADQGSRNRSATSAAARCSKRRTRWMSNGKP